MRNLYSRLVTNENARTEALVNLLERVLDGDRERNTRRFGDFVSRVLLVYATDEHRREAFVRWINDSATSLSVVTQYRIDGGTVPDIVIFNRGDPACVVEVKIDSPIGENQLEGYGGWLAERAGHRYKPALVLLTHVTPAPAGFTDRRCGSFSVALRSVASWNTVAEWFTELYLEEDGVDEPLKSLAGEYGEFLEEYVMATLDDVAIARRYWAQSHPGLAPSASGSTGSTLRSRRRAAARATRPGFAAQPLPGRIPCASPAGRSHTRPPTASRVLPSPTAFIVSSWPSSLLTPCMHNRWRSWKVPPSRSWTETYTTSAQGGIMARSGSPRGLILFGRAQARERHLSHSAREANDEPCRNSAPMPRALSGLAPSVTPHVRPVCFLQLQNRLLPWLRG